MLLGSTKSALQYLNAYLNDNEDDSYYMQISSRMMKTYMYTSLAAMNAEALEDGKTVDVCGSYASLLSAIGGSSQDLMQQMFSPKTNYKGIEYNYIVDFD